MPLALISSLATADFEILEVDLTPGGDVRCVVRDRDAPRVRVVELPPNARVFARVNTRGRRIHRRFTRAWLSRASGAIDAEAYAIRRTRDGGDGARDDGDGAVSIVKQTKRLHWAPRPQPEAACARDLDCAVAIATSEAEAHAFCDARVAAVIAEFGIRRGDIKKTKCKGASLTLKIRYAGTLPHGHDVDEIRRRTACTIIYDVPLWLRSGGNGRKQVAAFRTGREAREALRAWVREHDVGEGEVEMELGNFIDLVQRQPCDYQGKYQRAGKWYRTAAANGEESDDGDESDDGEERDEDDGNDSEGENEANGADGGGGGVGLPGRPVRARTGDGGGGAERGALSEGVEGVEDRGRARNGENERNTVTEGVGADGGGGGVVLEEVQGEREYEVESDGGACYGADVLVVVRTKTGTSVVPITELHSGDELGIEIDENGVAVEYAEVASVTHVRSNSVVRMTPRHVHVDGDDHLRRGVMWAFTLGANVAVVNVSPAKRAWTVARTEQSEVLNIVAQERGDGQRSPLSVQAWTSWTVREEDVTAITKAEAIAKANVIAERLERTHGAMNVRTFVATSAVHVRVSGGEGEALLTRRDGESGGVVRFGAAQTVDRFVTADSVLQAIARVRHVSDFATTIAAAAEAENAVVNAFGEMMAAHSNADGEVREHVVDGADKCWGNPVFSRIACFAMKSSYAFSFQFDTGFVGLARELVGDVQLDVLLYATALWLGDGHAGRVAWSVADSEEATVGSFIRRLAGMLGADVNVRPSAVGAVSTYSLVRGGHHMLREFWRGLGLFERKRVTQRFVVALLATTRSARMQFLAGLIDSDGGVLNMCDARSIVLEQSLEDVHGTHGGILTAFALVARSLGFDARYGERYARRKEILVRTEDGAWELDRRTAYERWETHGFRRTLFGSVYICGRTSTLPLLNRNKMPKKERQDFEGGISGVYALDLMHGDFPMVHITLKNGARKFVASNGMVLAT